jgi:hypothetical protein
MQRKVWTGLLAVALVCAWAGAGAAGQIGYSMRSAEQGFGFKQPTTTPSSAAMAGDAIFLRPLGTLTTLAGVGLFLGTLPWTLPTNSAHEAAQGLIGRPGGWTFKRPLGRRADPEFREPGVFNP